LKLSKSEINPDENLMVSVEVENCGALPGDEVVQLYVKDIESLYEITVRSLQGFKRISLLPGEKKRVEFTLTPGQFSVIDDENARVVEPGEFEISVGGKQPGFKGSADAHTTEVLSARFSVKGNLYLIED
jgi:beta-glucosidase